jgi:hypothetical protein
MTQGSGMPCGNGHVCLFAHAPCAPAMMQSHRPHTAAERKAFKNSPIIQISIRQISYHSKKFQKFKCWRLHDIFLLGILI